MKQAAGLVGAVPHGNETKNGEDDFMLSFRKPRNKNLLWQVASTCIS